MLVLLSFTALVAFGQARKTYTVRAGDTLYRIAVNHKLSVQRLQDLNGMSGTVIRVGQVLKLTDDTEMQDDSVAGDPPAVENRSPASDSVAAVNETPPSVTPPPESPTATPPSESSAVTPPSESPAVTPAPAEPEPTPPAPEIPDASRASDIQAIFDSTGVITHGEIRLAPQQSFFDLAFALGVPVDTLEAMNPDNSNVLADGPPVRVPARFAATSYRVKAGDTLYRIAAEHGISLGELRLANADLSDVIRVGQRLRIPSSVSPTEPLVPVVIAQGSASVYPERFAGRLMAGGQAYDQERHTVAHPALPFGTVVMIENADTGARTFAEVADRMPVTTDFVVEVSRAVAEAIDLDTGEVRVRIIHASN
jgi:LysM repeat protein